MSDTPLTFGGLFAGIGGFGLGFERAGLKCEWQVENDNRCNEILARHWPHVRRHDDVRTFPPGPAADWRVDVICGGFPCQPVSYAGHRLGADDDRWLWPEFARILRVLRPRYAVLENNPGLLSVDGGRLFGGILADLAALGFDAEWQSIRASDFALPHRRQRVIVVAYPKSVHGRERLGHQPDWPEEVFPSDLQQCLPVWVEAADRFVGVDDGFRGGAYPSRAHAAGNAIAVPVAEWIGQRIVAWSDQVTAEEAA